MSKIEIVSLVWIAIIGCPPTPVTPVPDASDAAASSGAPDAMPGPEAAPVSPEASVTPAADACALACTAVAAVGCPVTCSTQVVDSYRRWDKEGSIRRKDNHKPLRCADVNPSSVLTKDDARKLGFACP